MIRISLLRECVEVPMDDILLLLPLLIYVRGEPLLLLPSLVEPLGYGRVMDRMGEELPFVPVPIRV